MLKIQLDGSTSYDEATMRFIKTEPITLEFEHSLSALSKWESIWEKPFLSKTPHSTDETISYFHCMCLTPDVPLETIMRMSQEDADSISEYIQRSMTATWFNEKQSKLNREVITAEIIYYWMISAQVPMEWEHRHLNQLFTLIKVINAKNTKPTKMSHSDAAARQRAINEANKARYNTKG